MIKWRLTLEGALARVQKAAKRELTKQEITEFEKYWHFLNDERYQNRFARWIIMCLEEIKFHISVCKLMNMVISLELYKVRNTAVIRSWVSRANSIYRSLDKSALTGSDDVLRLIFTSIRKNSNLQNERIAGAINSYLRIRKSR